MSYAAFHPDCDVLNGPTAQDIARLAAGTRLPGLIIFGYKFDSLRDLEPFSAHLQVLKISGAPHLRSFEGIQDLPGLREFVLATPTGSAGSGRSIAVKSLAPLEKLPHLLRLVLHDVRPEDLDLAPIMRMARLQE